MLITPQELIVLLPQLKESMDEDDGNSDLVYSDEDEDEEDEEVDEPDDSDSVDDSD